MSFQVQPPERTLSTHTHAQTKSHFCSSLLFVIMKHQKITQGRLVDGGGSAARAVFADVCAVLDLSQTERSAAAGKIKLRCSYKGTTAPDAPLHSQQAVTYEWFVNEDGPFEQKTHVHRTVEQSLHHPPPVNFSNLNTCPRAFMCKCAKY